VINSYYTIRINKAIDYIEENLFNSITLEDVANVANFSKFHFHRIFKIIARDTLSNYVKRLKMENAAKLLTTEKNKTIKDISEKLGYHSNANFSRDFNEFYGFSPSEYKNKKSKPIIRTPNLDNDLDLSFAGIENLQESFVGYIRVAGGYDPETISKAYAQLYNYMQEMGILQSIDQCIGVGYDDPDYTPVDSCRYDACISMNKSMIPDNFPYNTKEIYGGKYATFIFSGEKEQFFSAWDVIFQEWLIASNYIPENKPHYEIYLPSDDYDNGIFKAKLCLPVKLIKTLER
jgi:AraC family transcriptional regulator